MVIAAAVILLGACGGGDGSESESEPTATAPQVAANPSPASASPAALRTATVVPAAPTPSAPPDPEATMTQPASPAVSPRQLTATAVWARATADTATAMAATVTARADLPAGTLDTGLLVDVGGFRLWIRCSGADGPTVLFDAPGAADHTELGALPDEVARFTRVCVYDRSGQGASDPGPASTSLAQSVEELRALMAGAGIDQPVVLAGYSWGGALAYLYTATYPEQVEGLVLIDAPTGEVFVADAEHMPFVGSIDLRVSGEQLLAAGPLPDVPLVVVSRGLAPGPWEDRFDEWQALQADLATSSPQGRLVIAAQSEHHDILDTDLALVVSSIKEVVAVVGQ
jgi:pimeloyl-ACP methyl ester carboxylesterase